MSKLYVRVLEMTAFESIRQAEFPEIVCHSKRANSGRDNVPRTGMRKMLFIYILLFFWRGGGGEGAVS